LPAARAYTSFTPLLPRRARRLALSPGAVPVERGFRSHGGCVAWIRRV